MFPTTLQPLAEMCNCKMGLLKEMEPKGLHYFVCLGNKSDSWNILKLPGVYMLVRVWLYTYMYARTAIQRPLKGGREILTVPVSERS